MIDRNEVLSRIDMLSIVSKYTQARICHVIPCFLPCHVHKNNTPSLAINLEKHTFKCFGNCGRSGSTIDLVMLMEGMSFIEALKWLAKIAGVEIDTDPATQVREAKKYQRESILTQVADYFYSQATKLQAIRKYLATRAIPEAMIDEFKLGYAVPSGKLPSSIPVASLLDAGLLKKNEKDSRLYPYFRNSLIFPTWRFGKCVGMTSRNLDPDATKPHLHLARPVDGLCTDAFFCEEIFRKTKLPFVTESPIDAISWHVAGYPTCGILGTNRFQEKSLSKIDKDSTVVLALDNDEAGIVHTERIGRLLMQHCGCAPLVIRYPAGYKDANAMLQKLGADGLSECADKMIPFPIWLLEQKWVEGAPAIRNIGVVRNIIKVLSRMTDLIEQDYYLREIASKSNISLDVLKQQVATQAIGE